MAKGVIVACPYCGGHIWASWVRYPVEAGAPDLYYTVDEAAKILKTTPRTIRRWCKDGTLAGAAQPGGSRRLGWRIPRAGVETVSLLKRPKNEKAKQV